MKLSDEKIDELWEKYTKKTQEFNKLPSYEEWRTFLKNEYFHRWQKSAILSNIDDYENLMETTALMLENGDTCMAQRNFYKAQSALHEAQISVISSIKYELDNYETIGNRNRKPTNYNDWRQKYSEFVYLTEQKKVPKENCD